MKNKFIFTQQSFSHQLCSLSITHRKEHTDILMQLFSEHVTTKTLPQTLSYLKKLAPSVLRTTCHNDLHLPFRKEVTDTEIGHLFEHLILDYCSQHSEDSTRTYYGLTEWDWHVDKRGTFCISVSLGETEQDLLYRAIAHSHTVLEKLFSSVDTLAARQPIVSSSHTKAVVAASV